MIERRVAVAYSAGRDSTALLHATLHQAAALGVEVLALHVHHGLSPHADAWLAHGQAQCRRWARGGARLEFVAHRLSERPAQGESIEAWARRARYRALHEMALAHGASVVLLAHHRRDQAETLLLQALRGAGIAGLSAMPRRIERDGVTWCRPWLDRPRAEIEAYVRSYRLRHVDDDSNADLRFARNRLRHRVWPALAGAFEQAEQTLAAAATWAQQASAALDELAAIDLARIVVDEALHLDAWLELSPARRSNALRAWLKRRAPDGVPASLIVRLLDELPARRVGRWPMGRGELRLYRGVLRCDDAAAVSGPVAPPRETHLRVAGSGRYELPGWCGALHVEPVREGGVPLAWLAHLELRSRAGAERYQAGVGRPPRSLKKQYQDAGVPTWQRGGPLVYSGGQLVFVPGLGLDARVIGLPGQPLASLRWTAAPNGA